MFDIKKFAYDPINHQGFYEGQLVPSVTQLLDIMFPLDENIPESRIQKAAEHGTKIHSALEEININFDNPLDYEGCLKEVANIVKEKNNSPELVQYLSFLSAYGLRPFDYENLVFLFDENGDLICYGHYDCTLMATKDIIIGEKTLFKEGLLYMVDYKTTSVFYDLKTRLQLSIYSLAYERLANPIESICGLWFTDTLKMIPFKRYEEDYVISTCKALLKIWRTRNESNID